MMGNRECESSVAGLLERHFEVAFSAPEGVKKLRELILTLAMKGKLVPQDPNDQPASELLREIETEKQRLVKDGKIKKPQTLPLVSADEAPYPLPSGWELVRLGEIVEVLDSMRKPVTKQDRVPGPYPYYGASGIVDYVSNYIFDEPLVLVGEDGAKWGKGENTAFSISGKTWVNNHAHVIRPDRSVLNDGFLIYCLVCMDLQSYITGMTVPKLNQARLLSILVPLPPLAEQHRIVARIDELMARCDALETLRAEREEKRIAVHASAIKQLLYPKDSEASAKAWQFISRNFGELYAVKENVAELRKAILQLAVMGKLVSQDPNDPPASELLKEIEAEKQGLVKAGKIKKQKPLPPINPDEVPYDLPKGWEWIKVEDVFTTTSGTTFEASLEKENGEYAYVKVGDMNLPENDLIITNSSRFVDPDEKMLRALIPSGSVIFPKRGGAIATNKKRLINKPVFVDLNIMAISPMKGVLTAYAYRWLSSIDLATLNTGTSVPQINHKDIDPLPFPLPPLPEQHRIVARIDELMILCDTLEQQIKTAYGKQGELLNVVMIKI